ncbi:MAG: 3-phosphoshikimate 1-carboxyvinyltransferase, partial [Acidobacteriaceae bacterium]|nr:3-phosphoshikimate 1-carboxyvinyltransferase [Acidobacteriaceae bacterium]
MSQATATRVIAPARNLLGSLRLPGDKSISHRYALLGGLAHGTTHLENFSTGADPASSLSCVAALGAKVERDGAAVTIHGCNGQFQPSGAPL